MKNKKAKSKTWEDKRFLFLEIGFIVALSAALMAFNYKTAKQSSYLDFDARPDLNMEEESVFIVKKQKPMPKPPTPAVIFDVIENDIPVETDFIIDVEDAQDKAAGDFIPYMPEEEPVDDPDPIVIPDQLPSFPGGNEARLEFLGRNIRYPASAINAGITGTVYISFVVRKDGKITDVKVLRGPGGGLNEEAMRVTRIMPDWIPGFRNGKPVSAEFTMPVKFILQ